MASVSFSLLSPILVILDSTVRTATLEPLSTATRWWVLKTLTQPSSEMQGWAQLLLSLDKGMLWSRLQFRQWLGLGDTELREKEKWAGSSALRSSISSTQNVQPPNKLELGDFCRRTF